MDITELLTLAVEKKASDLHLSPGLAPTLRIDGDLIALKEYPVLSPDESRQLVHSMMTEGQVETFQTKLVIDMSYSLHQVGNFRVSAYHQLRGVGAVLRVLTEKVPSFESLKLPSILKSLLLLSHGIILVTGPTGSGKTTTLASMIDTINAARASNIITIEDPIEYIYQNKRSIINQLQVGRDTPDFNTALKASLRQNPDVILLGEMRDRETVNLALTAAETGHLVMATMHAGSSPLAISRIVDMFPDEDKNRVRNLLSETVQAVLCQTFVKSTHGGRVAAFEIMLATPAIRHQIRQDKIPHMTTTLQTNGDIGMCTMEQYLQELLKKGIITQTAARLATMSQGSFRS